MKRIYIPENMVFTTIDNAVINFCVQYDLHFPLYVEFAEHMINKLDISSHYRKIIMPDDIALIFLMKKGDYVVKVVDIDK